MADVSTFRRILNAFRFIRGQASGMHTDNHVSEQPENTYRNAWGVSNASTEEKGSGLYNMAGQDPCGGLPTGYIERAHHFREEDDRHIYFSTNGSGQSEIGYIDAKTCKYKKIINDSDITGCEAGEGLLFDLNEWIPIESKYMRNGTCYELHLYWTNGTYYKRLNIDRPNLPIDCQDLYLLKCHAAAAPEAYASETGGRDLEGGVYQYVAQLEDNDGNTTNWFQVNAPVSIETPNNIAGERSTQAIHVRLTDLSQEYHKVNIATIKTIGGHPSAWLLAQLPYSTDAIEFVHRSTSQEIYALNIEEMLAKKNGYFRGYDIFQYEGRLMPLNLLGDANEDWQEIFDEIEVLYRIVGVPLRYAHLVSGMRADEVYRLSIRGNYCDGTTSRGFVLKGRKPTAADLEMVAPGDENCLKCEAPRWRVDNTAERTELICANPEEIGAQEEDIDYDTGDPIYEPTPDPGTPLSEDDEEGVLDDVGKFGDINRRQMECICKNLAFTFALFDVFVRRGLVGVTMPERMRELLSDPVAIASMKCACEELAKGGGADGDDTIPDNTADYGRNSPTDPIGRCPCCDECDKDTVEGRTESNCPCCESCIEE